MSLRIAFFGLPLAACLLKRDGHELALAVLSPIPAPGRRRLLRTSPHTPILDATPSDRGGGKKAAFDRRVEEALARAAPDLIVSWFWTRRLEARWLARAPLGGIGAHPSLLPRHRGPNPYFAAIDAGDVETGVSVHALTPEYDTGGVLLTRRLLVGGRDSWQLARALDRPSLALLRETVARFAQGTPPEPEVQREAEATWAPEPSGEALRVQWTWTNERVLRRIRALAPTPGLAVAIEDLELFITRAAGAETFPSALEPGEAAVFGEPPALVLRTGDGAVRVVRAVLPAEDDGPDRELDEGELARAVRNHLAGRNAGRVG